MGLEFLRLGNIWANEGDAHMKVQHKISNKHGTWSLELDSELGTATVVLFEKNLNPPAARGLGDVIARATSAIGITPCGGCKQRQEALNKLIPFNTNEPESKSDGGN